MDNNDIKKINSKKANKIIFKGNQKKPIKKSDSYNIKSKKYSYKFKKYNKNKTHTII